jgi:hypothetical protein
MGGAVPRSIELGAGASGAACPDKAPKPKPTAMVRITARISATLRAANEQYSNISVNKS